MIQTKIEEDTANNSIDYVPSPIPNKLIISNSSQSDTLSNQKKNSNRYVVNSNASMVSQLVTSFM